MKNLEGIDHSREILEAWKNSKVILASNSGYRKDVLKNEPLNFKNVETISIPEEIEVQARASGKLEQENPLNNQENQFTELPKRIAEAKLKYAIENYPGDTEGLFMCSMDTMPMFFKYELNDSGEPASWNVEYLSKPENKDKAVQVILSTFENLSEGYAGLQKLFQEQKIEDKLLEGIKDILTFVHLPSLIRANTGYAVKLPADNQIHLGSAYANLFFQSLFENMDNKNKWSEFAEKIIEIQGLPTTLSIAGGIDYSNDEVRKLLGIREIALEKDIKAEEGVFRGLPARAFEDFLLDLARHK